MDDLCALVCAELSHKTSVIPPGMTCILKSMALTGKIAFTSNFTQKRPRGGRTGWWSCSVTCIAQSLRSLFKAGHVHSVRTHFLSCLDLPKANRLHVCRIDTAAQTFYPRTEERKHEETYCFSLHILLEIATPRESCRKVQGSEKVDILVKNMVQLKKMHSQQRLAQQ